MDQIAKQLARLTALERKRLKAILFRIQARDLQGLDIKKFQGFTDLYRIRIGSFRIHLRRTPSGIFFIINLERRTMTMYRKKR